ncbi:uncharacterized protein LOC142223496 isoform X2 [Haematobia irritans]|uniref:uncharacterized protein LOC142223496 isoform X2 n=1 Tax=Haematobia irritans TaxID=7368 RepID=UPI003F4FA1BF
MTVIFKIFIAVFLTPGTLSHRAPHLPTRFVNEYMDFWSGLMTESVKPTIDENDTAFSEETYTHPISSVISEEDLDEPEVVEWNSEEDSNRPDHLDNDEEDEETSTTTTPSPKKPHVPNIDPNKSTTIKPTHPKSTIATPNPNKAGKKSIKSGGTIETPSKPTIIPKRNVTNTIRPMSNNGNPYGTPITLRTNTTLKTWPARNSSMPSIPGKPLGSTTFKPTGTNKTATRTLKPSSPTPRPPANTKPITPSRPTVRQRPVVGQNSKLIGVPKKIDYGKKMLSFDPELLENYIENSDLNMNLE